MENQTYAFILKKVIDSCGDEVLLDRERLGKELKEKGIDEIKCLQIQILASVPGFKELLQVNDATAENDIDRFIGNAQEITGFDRTMILELTATITEALGYRAVATQYQYENVRKAGKTFVVPFQVYEKELKVIQKKQDSGEKLTESDLKTLTRLSEEGIPEAQFYMSEYLKENNPQEAENLLLQSASQNCGEAQAALGDLYYNERRTDSWERAYDYYTGYGAIALNRTRRKHLKDILNHKIYNLKLLQKSLLILLAMLILAFLKVPGGMLGANGFVSTLFLLLDAGIWGATAYYYMKHPFAFLNWLVPAMSGIWGIYLIIWIL